MRVTRAVEDVTDKHAPMWKVAKRFVTAFRDGMAGPVILGMGLGTFILIGIYVLLLAVALASSRLPTAKYVACA